MQFIRHSVTSRTLLFFPSCEKASKCYKLIINLGLKIARTKYFTMYEEVYNLSKIPSILIKFICENFKCKLIEDFNLCSDNGHISDENIAKNHHAPLLKRQEQYI